MTAKKKPQQAKPEAQVIKKAPEWKNLRVKVSDLKPFEQNPREATKEQFQRLVESIKEHGYAQLILATHDLRVIDGHHRIKALRALGFKEVDIRVTAEAVSDEAFMAMIVKFNLNYAMWNADALANLGYDVDQLREWGMSDSFLFGAAQEPLPDLATGEKSPFQQMTFTLHDSQAEVVKAAIAEAQKQYPKDPNNENKNGNGLFFIAQQFLGE